MVRLTALGLPRATAPKRLITPEEGEEEDEPEGVESDQFLAQMSGNNSQQHLFICNTYTLYIKGT